MKQDINYGRLNSIPEGISKRNTKATTPVYDYDSNKYRRTENIIEESNKEINYYPIGSQLRAKELGNINKIEHKNKEKRQKSIYKVPISVEVCIRSDINLIQNEDDSNESQLSRKYLIQRIKKYFSLQANVELGKVNIYQIGDSLLRKVCTDINLSLNYPIQSLEEKYNNSNNKQPNPLNQKEDNDNIPIYQAEFNIYIYQLHEKSEEEYYMESNTSDEKNTDPPIWKYWSLPNIEFHGLWDVLHYDNNLKQQLLDYTSTSLILSDCQIDFNVINWNHLILLYGSPGTGKTSISRAISQKIGMRYFHRYKNIYLLEISAHSLFSKWFSESGKTVVKLFSKIKGLLEEPDSFVNIVIDEIESISTARKQSLGRNEPSDSIRVVNALLTQIDALKKYSNTLIMTTTNIPDSIDEAFLDRADLKLHIPLPSIYTRYTILLECIEELIFKKVVYSKNSDYVKILSFKEITKYSNHTGNNQIEHTNNYDQPQINVSKSLLYISKVSEGFSGRNLRKLPFVSLLSSYHHGVPLDIQVFLEKMKYIVDEKPEMVKS
ncbi:ATPase family associated with various cellular activities (AAA) family protein [Cryptosporidium meleagridis]|uniref:ATPase family associated with various cellular activities (AAA) family protein n=1 Tax=Cryptosporidium meleagridis TaxID=93969 RepID=A0A2P4Z1S5_9CRYT|nr:ATPase family associated with various cellular activities (AAA) family protein [Cryptosporidium meleagridis]